MIVLSRPVAQWFYPGATGSEEDYLSGNPIDRNILIFMMLGGVIVLLKRRQEWWGVINRNKYLLLFVVYCAISILWSDYPGVSFKRYLRGLGSILMILIVLTEREPKQAISVVIRRCAYVLIPLSIVLIKYYRDFGVAYGPWGGPAMNVGVATHKSSLGRLLIICGFYFYWKLIESWRTKNNLLDRKQVVINMLFALMIFWLLLKAHSATAIGSLIVGIIIFKGMELNIIKQNISRIGVIAIVLLFTMLLLQLSVGWLELIVEGLGREMTLTDRTLLWADILKLVDNPLIGTGYDSFWLGERLTILWSKWWFQPNETHNGYIDIYIDLGIIGLLIMAGVIFSAYKNIRRTLLHDYDFGKVSMVYFVMFLLYNITEASLKLRNGMFLIFLLFSMYYPRISDSMIPKTPTFYRNSGAKPE
jgi:O-antigen ligase